MADTLNTAGIRIPITVDNAGVNAALAKTQSQLASFANEGKTALLALRNIAVGLVGAFAITGLEQMVRQTAAQAEQMSNLSKMYGVSVETISSFRAASKLTGVS